MTLSHEKMPNSPTMQLVGGMNEMYVKYADVNSPTAAKPAIIAKSVVLLIVHPAVEALRV